MSVRKRKWKAADGTPREAWVIDVTHRHPDGRVERVRETSPATSKRDAEAHERQIVNALIDGAYRREADAPKAVPTVKEFAEEFLTEARANNKPSSVAKKEVALREHIIPAFGATRLDAVGPREVEQFKVRLLAGKGRKGSCAPKTAHSYVGVLGRMLRLAAEWGLIPAAPGVKNVRVPTTPVEFFSFDEARRLVEAAAPEWRTMVVVALKTGLRIGELLALRWEDVDLKAGRIVVRRTIWKGHEGPPKSGRDREVPLGDEVLAVLKAHRHLKGKTVFCNADGSMLTAAQCRPPIEAAGRKAGLTKKGWHVLRHTFASHLAMRGASAKEVQELLGHGSLQMTMRYMHLSPKARRDAVRLLDDLPTDDVSRHKEGT